MHIITYNIDSIKANTSSAFETSLPPAWAKSGLPPPPPSVIALAFLTKSPAFTRLDLFLHTNKTLSLLIFAPKTIDSPSLSLNLSIKFQYNT